MKIPSITILHRSTALLLLLASQLALSACTFNITRYTDGPITQYLGEPVPTLDAPLARTVSLEKIDFQTAVNMKATIISDVLAREIYLLPEDAGREVKELLRLDDAYSEEATYAALNSIARNKGQARGIRGNTTASQMLSSSTGTSPATARYIQSQERMATEAYRKGDYLSGDIHNSAAINAMKIDQSFAQAQASVDLAFGLLGAAAAAGEAMIKNDFIKLRNWLEFESGAIGASAPEGTHLSVFILQFFDAESFQLDSRNRVIVYLVLSDGDGIAARVLEASDILNCEGECNLFQPKPTARVVDAMQFSTDVRGHLSTAEGTQALLDSGFDPMNAFYDYILLQHGLQKLSHAVD